MLLLQLLGHLMAKCILLTSMAIMQGEDKYLFHLMGTLKITATEERTSVDMDSSYMGHPEGVISHQHLAMLQWDKRGFRNMVSIIVILLEVADLDHHTTRLQIQIFVMRLLLQVGEVAMHVILT